MEAAKNTAHTYPSASTENSGSLTSLSIRADRGDFPFFWSVPCGSSRCLRSLTQCRQGKSRWQPRAGSNLHTGRTAHASSCFFSHSSCWKTQEHPQVPICWRIPPEISLRFSLEIASFSLCVYKGISAWAPLCTLQSSSRREGTLTLLRSWCIHIR